MTKREQTPNLPDYFGIPDDENKLIVQKSNPLQTLSETGLTLSQFKILDAYLSRINSRNKNKRHVRFEKGQLEKILGVSRLLKDDLKNRLDNLFQKVTIKDKNKKNGFTTIALFEKAEAYQDDDGLWKVDLICTPSAMEYIFNIENLGYLRYRLKNIINLTSRYSYVLYLYLERHRDLKKVKTWKISIENLKTILNCTAESYTTYRRFNDLILKKCQKEINEKTCIRFSYKPVDRKLRAYTNIEFTLEKLPQDPLDCSKFDIDNNSQANLENKTQHIQDDILNERVPNDEQHNPKNVESASKIGYHNDSFLEILGCVCNSEFSPEQIKTIRAYLTRLFGDYCKNGGLEIISYDYLTRKMKEINQYWKKSKPKKTSKFTNLLQIIKKDIKKYDEMSYKHPINNS